jgi:hypothetical protein
VRINRSPIVQQGQRLLKREIGPFKVGIQMIKKLDFLQQISELSSLVAQHSPLLPSGESKPINALIRVASMKHLPLLLASARISVVWTEVM